ncbi:MAG: extracellular solute-binding protein [Verrucomicrobiia bacterium]
MKLLCALAILLFATLANSVLAQAASVAGAGRVVVYIAQDHVYAEPILKEFERETGIRAAPVYDSEAVKTVGLANRLLAERRNPQCDVFWGNEELRTRQLEAANVFRQTKPWAAIGYRSRRIVVNTNLLPVASAPKSLLELTNRAWSGKLALAYPLFGTTATHFVALRQQWGAQAWEAWCRAIVANKPLVVDGNSVVARLVARGEAWIGLTDSDDIAVQQRQGGPVVALPITEEALLIPNTIAVIRDAPNPQGAQRLWEYLQRPEVTAHLIAVHALEGAAPTEVKVRTLQPDWDKLLKELAPATDRMKEIFLR